MVILLPTTLIGLAMVADGLLELRAQPLHDRQEYHWRDAASCGVSCCFILLRLKDLQVTYEDTLRQIPIEPRGSSLNDMNRGCQTLGLGTKVMRRTPSEFDEVHWPAIAHLNPKEGAAQTSGHYVVVVGADRHRVHFVEPNYAATLVSVPRGDFLRAWSGYLLMPPGAWESDIRHNALVGYGVFCISAALLGIVVAVRLGRRIPRAARVPTCLALGACIASGVGCSGRTTAGPLGVARPARGALLTAWNSDADVGIIPPSESAIAEFAIQNTGKNVVDLDVGQPSCACSSIALDKRRLSPGETAMLRMGIAAEGNVGLRQANVEVMAVGQRWAQTFQARGIALGSRFPKDALVLDKSATAPLVLRGDLFTSEAEETCSVRVDLTNSALRAMIDISSAEISAAEPIGQCYRRAISIPLRSMPGSAPDLERGSRTHLAIHVSTRRGDDIHMVSLELTGAEACVVEPGK